MLSQLTLARQERATDSRCLKLPETFPTPRFSFGNWVQTDENDVGMIVGMTLVRSGSESWWRYDLDLTVESPNFWQYQGDHFIYENESEPDSPGCIGYPEVDLTPFDIAEGRLEND